MNAAGAGKKYPIFRRHTELMQGFRKDVETPPVEDEGYVIELAVRKNVDSADYKRVRAIVTSKDSMLKRLFTQDFLHFR